MLTERDRPRARRLAVLGSGPVGLDAALAALDAGFEVTVYEASGVPAANVRDWGHVRLFSPWAMNVSPRMERHLASIGLPLAVGPEATATGGELADRVLDPLWARTPLSTALRLGTRVLAVGREGTLKHEEIATRERARRPFRILLRDGAGREWVERAEVVLDCTGKYGNPNTLGDGGIPAPGERALGDRIQSRIPDLDAGMEAWAGQTVLLAGSGHSAQTVARDLAELGARHHNTRVVWVLRKSHPDWGAIADDPLPGRKELTDAAESLAGGSSPVVVARTGSVVESVSRENGGVRVRLRSDAGREEELHVDRIVSLTGGVGDDTLYRQLQVHECYAFSAPMKLSAALLGAAGGDCTQQESHGVDTLKNPEPNFFILGDKSYGRNNTFLLRVGWMQVDEVFAELARES
jgi:thioredoxin reductase